MSISIDRKGKMIPNSPISWILSPSVPKHNVLIIRKCSRMTYLKVYFGSFSLQWPPSSYQAGMTFLQVGFSSLCFIHRISYCWFFKWHGDRISFMNGMWKGPKIWWQLTLVRKRKKTKGILHWIVLLIMYNTCWIDSATFVPHKPSKRSKFHSVVSVIRSMHHSSATIYL